MAITEFFHLIHIVDEEDEIDTWVQARLAPQRFAPKHWMEVEAVGVAVVDRQLHDRGHRA